MRINVHAGHLPDGKKGCGAVGLIKESTENRKVAKRVIELLRADGHTVFDCTDDKGTSENSNLKNIVAKCNANNVDLDVSIHFNAGAYNKKGNGYTTGTECYIYSADSKAKDEATRICENISKLGYKNRGVKVKNSLYVLKNTKAPALLVECCFVDDLDDVKLYNTEAMAIAIASGIVGKNLTPKKPIQEQAGYKMQTLRLGSKGNDVTIFESIMKKMGYYTGNIDTDFGSGCLSACNKFQEKYPECGTNGKPDSTWGAKCWNKLFSLLGA